MTRPGPGKFEGNASEEISEILLAIVQNGLTDEQVGDVETIGWHALIEVGPEMLAQIIEADPQEAAALDLTPDTLELTFLVHEDNNGFFTYEAFEARYAAELVLDEWKHAESEAIVGEELE